MFEIQEFCCVVKLNLPPDGIINTRSPHLWSEVNFRGAA
jgi:hypothetical protein